MWQVVKAAHRFTQEPAPEWEVVEAANKFGTAANIHRWEVAQQVWDICDIPQDMRIRLQNAFNSIAWYIQQYPRQSLWVESQEALSMDDVYMDKIMELYMKDSPKYATMTNLEIVQEVIKTAETITQKESQWWVSSVEDYILVNEAAVLKKCMVMSCLLYYRWVPTFSVEQDIS